MKTSLHPEPERNLQRLFVLKAGDTFLVADAWGDLYGEEDGLFSDDTRLLSHFRLGLAGQRPSLLSTGVSQDNLYFTAHLTNHPLPPLGEDSMPQGVIHIERKRFIWEDRVFERVKLDNYSDQKAQLALGLEFDADFRDMFEVRGQRRVQRGKRQEAEVQAQCVALRYQGLDGRLRCSAISFSAPPASLEAASAEFQILLEARQQWELYLEIGPEPTLPGRTRYREAAARARCSMRQRQRRGAQVKASGRLFQSWLGKSRADLALLTTDLPYGPYPYAGIPWFSTPFGRDAIITALQTLWLDPDLARGVLAYLAEHQAREISGFRDAEPGKIMHETRKGEMSALNEIPFGRYYGGVDTTPLFVMLAGAYARRSADMAFIDEIWPALVSATHWIENQIAKNAEGFLAYARAEASGLLNQGWKDSHDSVFHADGHDPEPPIAIVEVQGYAFRAYLSMAELAEWRGDREAAGHWRQCAEQLRQGVERRFWLSDRQFYALAVDGRGQPCQVRASNVGHLLYCGLPEAARGHEVAQQLMSRAFNSGWGIRTLATEGARFNPMSYHNGSVWPHDVALCAAGVAGYDERDGAVRLLQGLFEAAARFGMRLPELFCGFERISGEAPIAYPVACLPQAWAAGSVFMLLQSCLGLHLDGLRCAIEIDRPRLPLGIDHLQIRRLRLGETTLDLEFHRLGERVTAFASNQLGPRAVDVQLHL